MNSSIDWIPIADLSLVGNERKYVLEAIKSRWISSQGPFVERFEKAFSNYIGTKTSSTCSNGTVALQLAYQACGVGKGDEIIVPAFTFVATANAATYLGAKPVFADVDAKNWTLDPERIEEKITKKTKAIVPVHIYGVPCDMKPIMEIAENHGLKVIEDCAEAHGAEYHGKKVGRFGDCAAFSFFANKIITTGEGGMVVSNNEEIFQRVGFLKNHGMDPQKRYWHPEVGYNYRMTALQAAFGLGQLEKIEEIIEKKQKIRARYKKELDSEHICFQESPPNTRCVWWINSIRVPSSARDALISFLKEKKIDSRRVFYSLEELPPYKNSKPLPISFDLSQRGLSIPSGPFLSNAQLQKVIESLQCFFA